MPTVKRVQKILPLRELIFFAYDDRTASLVIGPTLSRRPAIVPRVGARGHGRDTNPLRRIRRVGAGGEIRIGGRVSVTTEEESFWKAGHVCPIADPSPGRSCESTPRGTVRSIDDRPGVDRRPTVHGTSIETGTAKTTAAFLATSVRP